MKKITFLTLLILCTLLPDHQLMAHPGHGNNTIDGYSTLHILSEPIHLFSIGVIGLAVYVIIKKIVKVIRSRSS